MKSRVALGLALASLLASTAASADDTSSLEGLLEEEVVTTASKSAERASDAPAFSRSISAEEIRRFGIRSVAEAIDFLGAGLRTSQGQAPAQISGRGVGFRQDRNDHVLLLVDGHVLNEPLAQGANIDQGAGIPLELIDHIELIIGPGSAVYGSNAVLAVINVVTKSASDSHGVHVAAEVSPFDDARITATGGYGLDLFGKRTDVTAGVSYYRKDGPTYQVGPQNIGVNPATGQLYRFSGEGPATGIWGGTVRNATFVDVPGMHLRIVRDRTELIVRGAIYGSSFLSATAFDDPRNVLRDSRLSVGLRQGFPLGRIGEASVRAYTDLMGYTAVAVSSDPGSCVPVTASCASDSRSRSRRIGVDASLSFDWLHDRRLTTMLTAQAVANTFSLSTAFENADTGAALFPTQNVLPEQTKPVFATSLEQTYRPVSWFGLSAGARVDDDPRFDPVLSPRAAVTVNPWNGSTFKGIYSQAFRAPSYFETGAYVPSYLIGSPDLKPESVTSYELVTEQRFGPHRLGLDFFLLDYDETISAEALSPAAAAAAVAAAIPGARAGTAQLFQDRNVDDIHSYGFTATADTVLLEGALRVGGSFTGTFVHHLNDPEKVTVAPQAFGNAHASYSLGGYRPTLGIAGTFAGRTVVDGAYDVGWSRTPTAPPQLDLRATLSGPLLWVKGLSYRVIAGYTFHDRVPYAIGPATHPLPGISQPELLATQRWHGTVGLQYDF